MNIRYYLRDAKKDMTPALAYKVLRYPHITEKSTNIAQMKYMTFIIDSKFNKCDVKKACSIIFEYNVEKVNIINQKSRVRAFKGKIYKRATFKKAIVLFKNTDMFNDMTAGKK